MINKKNYKDIVTHGEAMFPLRVWTHAFTEYGQLCPYHWHDEIEFVYIKEGSCEFQIETDYIEVKKGEALFINSGILHSDHSLQYPYASFSIVFNPRMLASSIPDIGYSKYIYPILHNQVCTHLIITNNCPWGQEVLGLLFAISSLYAAQTIGHELLIKANLLKIFALFSSNHTLTETTVHRTSQAQDKIERLKKVIMYIQSNYHDKIRLEDLSNEVNLNPYYFGRFFKEATGKTPIDFLNQYRITKAIELLEETNEKITDIAFQVGFDNLSYFIRTFRQFTNSTPGRYRKISAHPK